MGRSQLKKYEPYEANTVRGWVGVNIASFPEEVTTHTVNKAVCNKHTYITAGGQNNLGS